MTITMESLIRLEPMTRFRSVVVREATEERRSLIDLLLATATALLGAGVVAWGIGVFPALGGDEGIYTSQAWAIAHGSITPYTYTYDHPFIGWAQLAPFISGAKLLHLGGSDAVLSARAVMVLYAFATLMLTYGVGRRLGLRTGYAVVSVLLVGLCPLFVVDARQVYLDNIALPWVLAAFYLALSPRRRQWTYGIAGVLFSIGVLSKETVLLFLPALAYVVWTRCYKPIRSMSMVAFVTLGTLVVAVYPLFALLRNEMFPGPGHVSLWGNGIMYQLASRAGSGALWQKNSARQSLLLGWLGYDHVLLLGGAAAAVPALIVRRLRPAGLAVVLWALPVLKPGGYLPAMYVIAALPFCGLTMAGVLDATHTRLSALSRPTWLPRAVTAATVIVTLAVLGSYLPTTRTLTFDRTDAVSSGLQAQAWVERNVPRDANVLVDPAFWTDLVEDGRGEPWHGVISYYQFDLDPISSTKNLPQGWQDIDYVVLTAAMKTNVRDLKLTRLAQLIPHSDVVASWGAGSDQVQVRRVVSTGFNHTPGGVK